MTASPPPPPMAGPPEGAGSTNDVPSNVAGDSFARLLARSAHGDETAFAALYDATAPRVSGLVLRLIRNHAVAEEVTQEVYLQAWCTASRFDAGRGSAMAWLITLAHARAVDRIRATEADSRRDVTYLRTSSMPDYDSTFAGAEASMEASRARAALASLSPYQRQALELAYFGGHTCAEVADIVGVPVGTAKTRIRDGLIRLRELVIDAA